MEDTDGFFGGVDKMKSKIQDATTTDKIIKAAMLPTSSKPTNHQSGSGSAKGKASAGWSKSCQRSQNFYKYKQPMKQA